MTTNYVTNELTIDLATRWESWGDEGFPKDFERRLRAIGTFSDEALLRIKELTTELETRLETRAPLSAIGHFTAAANGLTDYLDRNATIRCLEYLDQPRMKPVTWGGRASPDVHMRRRPLTDIEMGLTRFCSLSSWRRSGPVGALDAGMASGELGVLLPAGVRCDANTQATHLEGTGTLRPVTCGYPVAAPRTMEIPTWARSTFSSLLVNADPARPILYGGDSVDPGKIQSLILMNINKVLALAGLAHDPAVKPLSIRNTTARRAYGSGGIEAAAELLGMQDFNSVAREIGIKAHLPARKR
jgi:hypothetical protein